MQEPPVIIAVKSFQQLRMVAKMIKLGLLEPLDISLLPNFDNLDPKNLQPYYDPDNRYSLPWRWGTTGLAYDEAQVHPAPDSWAVLWDPQYTGRITMLNDMREQRVARTICLGDIVGYAAQPRECAEIVRTMECPVLKGNHDSAVVEQRDNVRILDLPNRLCP